MTNFSEHVGGITGRGIIGEASVQASSSLVFEGSVVNVNKDLFTFDTYTLQGSYIFNVIIPKNGGYSMPIIGDNVVIEILPISGQAVLKYSLGDIIIEDQSESAQESNTTNFSNKNIETLETQKKLSNLENSGVSSETRMRLSANPYNPVLRKNLVKNDLGGSRDSRIPNLPEGSTVVFDTKGGSHMTIEDNGDLVIAISDSNIIKMIRGSETFLQTFRRLSQEWPGGMIDLTDEKEEPDLGQQDFDLECYPDTNNHKGNRWHYQFGYNNDHNDKKVLGYLRKYTGKKNGEKFEEILRNETTYEKDGGSTTEKLYSEDSKKRFEKKIDWTNNTITIQINNSNEEEKIKLSIDLSTGELTLHSASSINLTCDSDANFTVGGTTNINSSGNTTVKAPTITLDGNVVMT